MAEKYKSAKDMAFYVEVLQSQECQCGRPKARRYAVCRTCYRELPQHLKDGLWLPIRGGFEESYEAAVKWLED